jgi:hypothetical protein
MPQFDYCPPFEVYSGATSTVKPLLETHSLENALDCMRTRANTNLTVRILVTEGQTSTLVPVRVVSSEVDGQQGSEIRNFLEIRAEQKFRSLVPENAASATTK